MPVERLDDPSDPRLSDYRHVWDPELLRRGEIFVAEGRLVVRTLLADSPFVTRSLLLTATALEALRDVVEPRLPGLPVYIVGKETIQQLTGFNIHRGCLAIGERPERISLEQYLSRGGTAAALRGPRAEGFVPRSSETVIVLEHIVDADNVGSIFRNAAAFGASAVVLGPNCCDPLYRKAIRTSMGAALRVPFAHAGEWPGALALLRERGFTVVALTPRLDAVPIEEFVRSAAAIVPGGSSRLPAGPPRRFALLAGSEGPGLSESALAAADAAVRIPMAGGVDSLNVATAVAIALHRLRQERR